MGHALIIPNADFSDVAATQVTLKNKNYNFSKILQDFITVTGYTPNNIEITALEHLTTNLIKYNIWNKIDALYLLLGTTYQTCRCNWKDATIHNFTIQDDGSSFALTDEHRLSANTDTGYVTDYDEIDVEDFHSMHFIKITPNSNPLCFPLTWGGTSPEHSITMYNYLGSGNLGCSIRDNYNYSLEKLNIISFDLTSYYDIQETFNISGLFNRKNNTIKYASHDFSDILVYNNENLSFFTNSVYYLSSYESNRLSKSMDRVMGFGKALSDTLMTRYMQILNTYIEETTNAY